MNVVIQWKIKKKKTQNDASVVMGGGVFNKNKATAHLLLKNGGRALTGSARC